MLSRELMALLALGILWLNAGLIVAVAFKQLRHVLAMRAQFRAALRLGELTVGQVVEAREGERLARRHIQQKGRAITTRGPARILFTDGPQAFEVLGGAIETAEGRLVVAPAAPGLSEVWNDEARLAEALSCPGPAEFDRAFDDASRSKGFAREVDVDVRVGDRVWVLGRRDGDRVSASETRPLLVSMIDPIAWTGGRARLLVGFLVGASLALLAVTGLALWPPHFGLLSSLGGAAGLAYFLIAQPVAVAVRNAVRSPARKTVGALWSRGQTAPATAPS